MAYRHIAMFRIHDHVDAQQVDEAVASLQALGELPGILEWTVRRSDDERKGRIVVENGLFDARGRVEEFRVHPRHAQTAAVMREIADWWIADYPED